MADAARTHAMTLAPDVDQDKIQDYVQDTRQLSTSYLLILPLVVFYQLSISNPGAPVRNIAEVWLTNPSSWLGPVIVQFLNFAFIFFFVISMCQPADHHVSRFFALIGMTFESLVYAGFLLLTMGIATRFLLTQREALLSVKEICTTTGLGVGAAVYEEVFFRLILVGGTAALLIHKCHWNRELAIVPAILLSSGLFALAHHVGPLGDRMDAYLLTYRTLSGVALGLVFVTRGLGIAVGTHACYNILVVYTQA